jgi:four helix bundle protein
MAGVYKFEELISWQKARALTCKIYHATRMGTFAKDFGLANQIQRASVSVMSNIAEGFERGRPNEFHQFLLVAKGSCGEVRCQLYVALDVGHVTERGFADLHGDAEEVARLVGALRSAVDRKRS